MKNHARHAVRFLLTTLLLAALAIAPAAPSLAAWIDHPTEVDGLPPTSGQPGALTPSEIDPDELKNSYRTSIPQALEPSAGELVVSLRAVLNYFDARSSGYDELQRLPLFKIPADSCDHAASDLVVLHPLRGFAGVTPEELIVVKALGDDVFMKFTHAATPASLTGRKFAVISDDLRTLLLPGEPIAEGCHIALCIPVADTFFNIASEGVIDPSFVYTHADPGPEPTPTPDPDPTPGPAPIYPRYFESELPAGLCVARGVSYPYHLADAGLRRDAERIVRQVPKGSYLALDDIVIDNILDACTDLDPQVVVSLPVMRGYVTYSRPTGLFMIDPSHLPWASSMYGKKAGDVRIVKALNAKGADAIYYKLASSLNNLADGKFAITHREDGRPPFLKPDEELQKGKRYYLLLAIKDNGPYDACDERLAIADPGFATVAYPKKSDDSDGCAIGGTAPTALSLVLPVLVALLRKRW